MILISNVQDTTVGTLSQRITDQLMGLKGLNQKLADMKCYLEKVAAGELPMNHEITYQLQDIFNLLPDVTNPCFVKSLQVILTLNSPSKHRIFQEYNVIKHQQLPT